MLTSANNSFSYAGSSRRVSRVLAALLAIDLFSASAAGYDGLDRFGRVTDLHAISLASGSGGAGATVARQEYGYDLSGNRTFARVTQRPTGGLLSDPSGSTPGSIAHANDRSYAYGYDGLQRLTSADLGEVDTGGGGGGGGTGVPPVVSDPFRAITWTLDNLGNWSGDSAGQASLRVQGPGDAAAGIPAIDTAIHHTTTISNAIEYP